MTRIVPAGLVNEPGGPVVVEDVVVAPPGPGEVLVRMKAAGLCHTDMTGNVNAPAFPTVLGHEGAGIVEEVGPDVTSIAPGTPVVLSWRVPCGQCRWCRRGRQPWCERPAETAAPRVHRRRDGAPVLPFLRAGTFCPYAVAPVGAAIPIPAALPFAPAALIGCGVATGVGAALFDAQLEPGMDVAVFGLGGVGLNVVQGASLAQATTIVAIDRLPRKIDLARRFGATEGVVAGDGTVARVRELTGGRGVDVAFDVVGHPAVMAEGLEALAPGGTLILVGAPASDDLFSFTPRPGLLVSQRTMRGCVYGSCRPAEHFPLFARWALEGKLKLDELISRTVHDLAELNDAFAALQSGEQVRTVLLFPD